MPPTLRVRREQPDGIVDVVELSRPDVRNALDRATIRQLRALIANADTERAAAYVLTGRGTVFCAGGDLKERRTMSAPEVRGLRREIVDLIGALARAPLPFLAAVNGDAWGGGFELALACDFIIAADDARFGLPEIDLGVIPGGGGTQTLVRLGGLALAREVVLLGRVLSSQEALAAGIIHQVVPREQVVPAAVALAEKLSSKPRLAMRQARTALVDAWGFDLGVALARENELYDPCIGDVARAAALEHFATRNRSREIR